MYSKEAIMGTFGIKALESDEGMDIISLIEEQFQKENRLNLSEMIKKNLSKTEIDYWYDVVAIAIAELFVLFKEQSGLPMYENEDITLALSSKKSFIADKESLKYLVQYLKDIRDEKPDTSGIREYPLLWRESSNYKRWRKHIDDLIDILGNTIVKTG